MAKDFGYRCCPSIIDVPNLFCRLFQDEFFGTPRVTAVYLKHVLKCDKKVYLIGSQGVAEELRNVGIESTPVCVSSLGLCICCHNT